jgi:hypothetical protein
LQRALEEGHLACAEVLLDAGASFNFLDTLDEPMPEWDWVRAFCSLQCEVNCNVSWLTFGSGARLPAWEAFCLPSRCIVLAWGSPTAQESTFELY